MERENENLRNFRNSLNGKVVRLIGCEGVSVVRGRERAVLASPTFTCIKRVGMECRLKRQLFGNRSAVGIYTHRKDKKMFFVWPVDWRARVRESPLLTVSQ